MEIGIGLPNAVPGTTGEQLTEFAQRAEARDFSTLGTIDRLVYPNHEPLVALAAAAAVTERIDLATTILIAPNRLSTALLAKQAASVDVLSGGRLTLGVAIGAREDDYTAAGASLENRGKRLDEQLEEMKRIWDGEERGTAGAIGPPSDGGPQLVIGGHVGAAIKRAVRFGDGWIMGGGTPDQFAELAQKVRSAWSEAGRDGEPRLMSLLYYALGDDAERLAHDYITDYYAFIGDAAEQMAAGIPTDADSVRGAVSAFDEAGCGELIPFPCSPDAEQVDLLADAVGK